jgi:hypothetical protein
MVEAVHCRIPLHASVLELLRLEILQDANIVYCHYVSYCTGYHFFFAARALVFIENNGKQAEAPIRLMISLDFDEPCITAQRYLRV